MAIYETSGTGRSTYFNGSGHHAGAQPRKYEPLVPIPSLNTRTAALEEQNHKEAAVVRPMAIYETFATRGTTY